MRMSLHGETNQSSSAPPPCASPGRQLIWEPRFVTLAHVTLPLLALDLHA